MEQPSRRWSVSVGGVVTAIALLFLLSSFSWVPSSVLAPFVGPQRVERPADGYAVSFPLDWEHADADAIKTDGTEDEWWDSEKVDPEEHHAALLATGGLLLARTTSPFAHETCRLYDYSDFAALDPAWATLDDAMAFYASFPADPDAIETQTVLMDLAAGRVLCIDVLMKSGEDWRDYLFTDGTTWYLLSCGSPGVAPEGRWLSIAETFEFLPAEA